MKNIVKFAVSNPVTICMVVLAILLLGKISYDQLSVDLLPDLNNPHCNGEKHPLLWGVCYSSAISIGIDD